MKYIVLLLAIFLLLVFGCGSDGGTTPEDTTPRVSFSPSSITINSSESATVAVNLANLPHGIFALAAQIEFNTLFIGISEESFHAGSYFAESALTLAEIHDSIFSLAVTNTRGSGLGGSDGTIFEFQIHAIAPGSSPMSLLPSSLQLYDEDGNLIGIPGLEFENATVTVTD